MIPITFKDENNDQVWRDNDITDVVVYTVTMKWKDVRWDVYNDGKLVHDFSQNS
jgi:hypothetical protein